MHKEKQRLSGQQISAIFAVRRRRHRLFRRGSPAASCLENKTQPFRPTHHLSLAPECLIRYLDGLQRHPHMNSTLNTISLLQHAHKKKRANIQICVWHFHHDCKMNNSGLKCRRWRELSVHTRGPSVRCAVGFAGQSSRGPLWAPFHRLLMAVQEEERAIIKSLRPFRRGRASGKKGSKRLRSFHNNI